MQPLITCLSRLLALPPTLHLSTARGKAQELRDELRASNDKRDKGYTKKKVALKKVVANMTMGNDGTSPSHLARATEETD